MYVLYYHFLFVTLYWRSEHARASAATIRSSKWKLAMYIWYVQFYLEAIGGVCRVEGRGFEPLCCTFFFLPPFLFSPFLFPSPFHFPLQARSATSMLKYFSSYDYVCDICVISECVGFLLVSRLLGLCLLSLSHQGLLLHRGGRAPGYEGRYVLVG